MRIALFALACSFVLITSCGRKVNRVVNSTQPAQKAERPAEAAPAAAPTPRFTSPPAVAERVYMERDSITPPDPRTVPIPTEATIDRRRPTPSPVTEEQLADRDARDAQRAVLVENQRQMLRAKNLKALSKDAQVLFSLTKTPCYGKCEEYKLDVLDNGVLRFEGRQNTRLRGEFYTEPMRFKFDELFSAYRAFMETKPAAFYPDPADAPADAPSTVLSYPTDKGKVSEITVWYNEPDAFKLLMDTAQDLLDNQRWEK